ncbi:hypothetical protein SAMN05880558_11330 [Aeromonas sp. RU39B]|uniref:pyocin knob domain-containing protein n=1 Tax=Aeromonas sp. RU39B TaxID=1907416 RepID=UPI0009543367|nr:pyocin knob domain-containing protein [Aeromonas sp. RU39B]SIR40134.1 hypothetical protein SAMN05880558_11330 [Aeromonas sp. RU39B]
MANDYYNRLSEMNPGEVADGLAVEQEFDAIARGFAKLPTPHRDGGGFEGPTKVGDPTQSDEAVNLGTLEKLNLPMYRKKITSEDWNSITTEGVYDVVNASGSNAPNAYPYGVLVVYVFNGTATQLYYPDRDGTLKKRTCTNVASQAWLSWDSSLSMSMGSMGFVNAVINGDMRIVQRAYKMPINVPNNYFEYGVDRFYLGNTAGAASNVVMSYRHAMGPNAEFPWAAQAYTLSTGVFSANGVCYFEQPIEGLNLAGFVGVPLVVSFWVKSSVAGKYSVGLAANDGAANTSQIAEYTINAPDVWEKKSVKLLAVPSAAVAGYDTSSHLRLRFAFAGRNDTTSPGAWASGNFFTVSNQAHMAVSAGNSFYITGVQLVTGVEEKPFEHRPYQLELALCRRYCYRHNGLVWLSTPTQNDPAIKASILLPTEMRVTPSVIDIVKGNAAYPVTVENMSAQVVNFSATSAGYNNVQSFLANAEL